MRKFKAVSFVTLVMFTLRRVVESEINKVSLGAAREVDIGFSLREEDDDKKKRKEGDGCI